MASPLTFFHCHYLALPSAGCFQAKKEAPPSLQRMICCHQQTAAKHHYNHVLAASLSVKFKRRHRPIGHPSNRKKEPTTKTARAESVRTSNQPLKMLPLYYDFFAVCLFTAIVLPFYFLLFRLTFGWRSLFRFRRRPTSAETTNRNRLQSHLIESVSFLSNEPFPFLFFHLSPMTFFHYYLFSLLS
jgi:4-amino-4-deoxy-L-arabinose transferase-like glycosyltransferase